MVLVVGAYKLLQVGCIHSRQKWCREKSCNLTAAVPRPIRALHTGCPSFQKTQPANQRMKYSHSMEWSLTHPAMRKFCWLFLCFFTGRSVIIRISQMSQGWCSIHFTSNTLYKSSILLIYSFCQFLESKRFLCKCICKVQNVFYKYVFLPHFKWQFFNTTHLRIITFYWSDWKCSYSIVYSPERPNILLSQKFVNLRNLDTLYYYYFNGLNKATLSLLSRCPCTPNLMNMWKQTGP